MRPLVDRGVLWRREEACMSSTRIARGAGWTWDSYLAWEARQPLRYELVDGDVQAMTGGTGEHDTIALNIGAELRERLRGTPCRAHGSNLKVKAGANGRYPDALIDCGPRGPGALVASEPVCVFEVLSRSTALIDQTLKLRDYDQVASVATYVLFDQEEPRALVYRRDAPGRLSVRRMSLLRGLEAVLELPELGVSVPFPAVYEGVEFARPA